MAVNDRNVPMFKAAAVQAAPVWCDLDGTIEKTIILMERAAEAEVNFLAFPEVWLPGYPVFVWMKEMAWQRPHRQRYKKASIELGSSHHERLEEAVRQTGVTCLFGFSEKEAENVFMSQMLVTPEDGTVMARRKIKPSGLEGTFFASGGPENLKVVSTRYGNVGALNCSEHRRPFLRHRMYSQNQQLHVASWPNFGLKADPATVRRLWDGLDRQPIYGVRPDVVSMQAKACMTTTRAYAREGGLFVLAPTIIIDEALVAQWAQPEGVEDQVVLGQGATMIFDPMGEDMARSLAHDEEGLLIADIDYEKLRDVHDADPVFEKVSLKEYHSVFFG